MRSLLVHVREAMSVMRGLGKMANEAIHSDFIASLIFHPSSISGGVRGIRRGRSMNRAARSDEIDLSKDTEHVLGKKGLARKGRLMKR